MNLPEILRKTEESLRDPEAPWDFIEGCHCMVGHMFHAVTGTWSTVEGSFDLMMEESPEFAEVITEMAKLVPRPDDEAVGFYASLSDAVCWVVSDALGAQEGFSFLDPVAEREAAIALVAGLRMKVSTDWSST